MLGEPTLNPSQEDEGVARCGEHPDHDLLTKVPGGDGTTMVAIDDGPSEPPEPSPPATDREVERLSDQLERWFAADRNRTIGELIDGFGTRSFAVSFVVLMAFPALPLPTGGLSHLLEAATMLLALELVVGRSEVWVPERWRDKELAGLSGRAGRALVKRVRGLERFARPRLGSVLDRRTFRRFFGMVVFGLSLAAFVAPPFSGLDTLPALGVVLLSVGVLLHDTVLALVGLVVGALGVGLIIGIGHAITRFF